MEPQVIPSAPLPSGWVRIKNNPQYFSQFPLSERRNQYRFIFPNSLGLTCTYICGPRSFLRKSTFNGQQYYYCERDTDTRYWGDSSLSNFPNKCFPDVFSSSPACQTFLGGLPASNCIDSGIPNAAKNAGVTKCCYNDALG